MAYSYNPYQQYPQYPQSMHPMQQAPQQGNGLIFVQGENAAKSYIVAPNASVLLLDSEQPIFYIKSADQSGMPSLRVFDYTERNARPSQPVNDYVTRKEWNELLASMRKEQKHEQPTVGADESAK